MDIKLLDYFAAQALEGITSHAEGFNCPAEDAAAVAYKYAVAMMRERIKISVKRPDDEIDAQLDADTDKKEDEWLATESMRKR